MSETSKILVVDDDKEMESLLQAFLSGQGYAVKTAGSASQAMRWIQTLDPKTLPALVLSDVKMGPMSGIDLTKQLKETNPNLPVILFSAFGSQDLERDALQSGAVKFIHKPFPLSLLAELLKKEIEKA